MTVTPITMVLHSDGEGCPRGIVHDGPCSPYEPRASEFGAGHGDTCDCFICCDRRGEHYYHATVPTDTGYRGVCACGWHSNVKHFKRGAYGAVAAHVRAMA